ncbi:MAG: 23S rRNA (pseudouridine(1915)-N(3))-methyltransferase RlmH [Micavibrio aeruginosavorus]|uniref:Ribosomal RNA large subunit methyltransferase H n=1 Tax=Micavibrio aeruginosavorus TaxID=349221 RepID=A0A7T5UIX1_9BACT|nr:MAG: 23S rRNA (pseudouridine(1915)-N(3))-methyltransferase RlmH [Micavibrio aeruginosavorus]
MRIEIIAAGRLKKGPFADLRDEYLKRMVWPVSITEIEGKNASEEHDRLLEKIRAGSVLIALDERGKVLGSRDFAARLSSFSEQGITDIQFMIGGADGLNDKIRQRARFLLAFGPQTWPHMMVRVMLLEQLYRAQQITAGHPYHRD